MTTSSPSRHLVDAELLAAMEPLHHIFSTLSEETLSQFRAFPAPPPASEEEKSRVDVSQHQVPGFRGAPDVEVHVYRAKAVDGRLPCVVQMHGGGFVLGSAQNDDASHTMYAAELRCCVVAVEYRRAPETRYPGALHDCFAAVTWVMTNAEQLQIDPACVGVTGDSAGGGLAAAVSLMARDLKRDGAEDALPHPLRFQHLIYPCLDDRTCTREVAPVHGEYIWTQKHNTFAWGAYLGTAAGAESVDKLAAPARATNDELQGLPPTFIGTSNLDLFFEEDLDYARRLSVAGVPCELHVYQGAPHGYLTIGGARISQQSVRDSLAFLDGAMGREVSVTPHRAKI